MYSMCVFSTIQRPFQNHLIHDVHPHTHTSTSTPAHICLHSTAVSNHTQIHACIRGRTHAYAYTHIHTRRHTPRRRHTWASLASSSCRFKSSTFPPLSWSTRACSCCHQNIKMNVWVQCPLKRCASCLSYVCVYVCMCVCVCIYIYIYIYTHTHKSYICMSSQCAALTFLKYYAYMKFCVCVYIHAYKSMYLYTYAHICTQTKNTHLCCQVCCCSLFQAFCCSKVLLSTRQNLRLYHICVYVCVCVFHEMHATFKLSAAARCSLALDSTSACIVYVCMCVCMCLSCHIWYMA